MGSLDTKLYGYRLGCVYGNCAFPSGSRFKKDKIATDEPGGRADLQSIRNKNGEEGLVTEMGWISSDRNLYSGFASAKIPLGQKEQDSGCLHKRWTTYGRDHYRK